MKKAELFMLLFCVSLSGFSQIEKLIPEATEIKLAFDNLEKNPGSSTYQVKYMDVFPGDASLFKKIFASPKFDQLYKNSHLYIFKFAELGQEYPERIGDKLIKLCVGLEKWEADAVGYVQHVTIEFANTKYPNFISLAKNLNQEDLSTLIIFLADVENHSVYKEYQNVLDKLRQNCENTLLAQFKKAREERMNQKDH